jgi:abortive infection bacteriophage resistance protein
MLEISQLKQQISFNAIFTICVHDKKKSTSRLCCTHTIQTENKQKIQYQDISFKA